MADDTTLRLSATFDTSQIESGMQRMAAAVQTSTEKTAQNFTAAQTSVKASEQQLAATFSELPSIFGKAGSGGITAFEEVKRRVIDTTKEVAALREEILHTNDAARLEQLNEQLATARQNMAIARGEMRAMRLEMTETREKADMLGESFGVRIPGALGRLLGQMPSVQKALGTAFEAGIVIFFISQIAEAIEKLGEFTESLAGLNEEVKKSYETALDENQKLIIRSLELKEKLDAVGVVGKEGAAKYAAELKNSESAAQRQAALLKVTLNTLQQLDEQIKSLEAKKTWVYGPFSGLAGINRELAEAQASLKRWEETRKELEGKLRERPVEEKTKGAEEDVATKDRQIAAAQAINDAKRTLNERFIAYYENGLHEMYQAGQISLEQELEGERSAALAKLEIERQRIEKKKQLLGAEAAAHPGKNVGPEITTLNAQLESEEIKTQQTLNDIDAREAQERLRQRNEVNLATIQAAKTTGDAEINAAEQAAKEEFAAHKITIDQETEILKAAANQRIDNRKSELAEELRQAEEFPEKNKALIIRLNGELAALESQRNATLESIDRESNARRLADARARMEEELRMSEESATRQLETALSIDDRRLRSHQITLAQWVALERSALAEWYSEQTAAIDRAIARAKELYSADSVEYKKLIDKKEQLDEQWAQKNAKINEQIQATEQRIGEQISRHFDSVISQMILKQKSFGQAMQEVWTNLVIQFAQSLARMLTQFAAHQLMELTIQKTTDIEKTVSTTVTQGQQNATIAAGQAAQTAAVVTSQAAQTSATVAGAATRTNAGLLEDLKSITRAAATAAAHVFKWIIENVPFPINVALAPAAAAGVFTAVMAFETLASAAGGMHVDKDQVVQVHAGEMIVPADITKSLKPHLEDRGMSFATPKGTAAPPNVRFSPQQLPAPVEDSMRALAANLDLAQRLSMNSAAEGMVAGREQFAFAHAGESIVRPESIARTINDASRFGVGLPTGTAEALGASRGGNASPAAFQPQRGTSGGTVSHKTMNNNVKIQVTNQGKREIGQDEITAAVNHALKMGEIRMGG